MDHLSLSGNPVYLYRLRASMAEAHEYLDRELRNSLSRLAPQDLPGVAKDFGVPVAVIQRMVSDAEMPDAILLYSGIQAARILPELPVDAICDVRDALAIEDATDRDIREVAHYVVSIAEQAPIDSDIWAGASLVDKMTFQRAVSYARTLIGS
ncbi:hypothetical protein ACFHYQ_27350 [Sphaerimonospora cavernae]|uniref:Uncharacterized protein n=1 Tax=Sphaerimonospora cavernae TaxID=1740611 RepID=A0ABV6UCZ5_9ACTN